VAVPAHACQTVSRWDGRLVRNARVWNLRASRDRKESPTEASRFQVSTPISLSSRRPVRIRQFGAAKLVVAARPQRHYSATNYNATSAKIMMPKKFATLTGDPSEHHDRLLLMVRRSREVQVVFLGFVNMHGYQANSLLSQCERFRSHIIITMLSEFACN
jgi:hypothetical protein